MASNLSTIGFQFEGEEQFREAMLACAAQAREQIPCAHGHYGIWRSRSGAEIWFHLGRTPEGAVEIFGLTPFFEGKSDVPLALSRTLARESDNPFEGALHGYVKPQSDGEGGSYPVVFDAVDFALSSAAPLPGIYRARLAAFARELSIYPDEEAYYAAHEGSEQPVFAAQAFIPIGLFAAEHDVEKVQGSSGVPASTVLFTGKIIEHNLFTNEASGREFVWLLVETLDATIDVLADPCIVTGAIEDGGIVEVSALLFGRLIG
ncbi:MAG: hypothetical protein JNL45_03590 [Hyphomicrobium sp.]|jgi:hypothetical protein|nr:hypothetical protein [Hyphomicrobium sp.]